jgi:bisphosphoglycerate-dependent phosphoglycerate mutase
LPEEKLNYKIEPTHAAAILRDNLKITGNHIFYIIRHGQAQHNLTGSHFTLDTELTPEGKRQAKKAGIALLEIMMKGNEFPKKLFVSDLRRTHQTMNHVIMNMYLKLSDLLTMLNPRPPDQPMITDDLIAELKNLTNIAPDKSPNADNELRYYEKALEGAMSKVVELDSNKKEFVVLPCASELSELDEQGNCDQKTANASVLTKMARENYSRCQAFKNESGTAETDCPNEQQHPLDWKFYLEFYGGLVRSQLTTQTVTKQSCRDTNMLSNAIRYLSLLPRTNGFGGTRKKRKTKRKRKTRK